ncbi:MAG: proline dehydrogenase [Flavobacteriales bacterium CG18_big_fil_WC_8_21_14_2_50_32_9]|nr:proline dehydrogenase [Flavobacteriales bacterium]PIQ15543.1 MAG: proline dehydrogenase [Flavobacteriales bacterium CG18_big_fil_WC_8_21_14_2_50_32_9]
MNFDNTEIAFADKTNADLKKSYWLFKIIGWSWLIKIGPTVLKIFMPFYFPIPIIKATIFKQFCGGESIEDCETTISELANKNVKTILDYSVEGKQQEEVFEENLQEALRTIQKAKQHPFIPFSVIKLTGFARFELLQKMNDKKQLSEKEIAEFEKVKNRVNILCETAFNSEVPLFIDAEETWIQDPIDMLVLEMMQKYNKQKAIVYNTVQLYRWDRLTYFKHLLEIAEKENFFIGMKLVRGAYVEKERERAINMNYKDPIQKTKEDTDKDFNLALKFCVENINRISFCCGTHNEESSQYLIDLMKQHQLAINDSRIYFAQLLGMSNHISINLAKANFNVAKYVPYGPVKDVTPYLIRRAEENTSIAGQTGRELQLILKELERRK